MTLWIIGIHFIEANLLNPKIIGTAAKIHPVLVIFSLFLGEHSYGLVGALLAVPVLSAIQVVFMYFYRKTWKDVPRRLGEKTGPITRSPPRVEETPVRSPIPPRDRDERHAARHREARPGSQLNRAGPEAASEARARFPVEPSRAGSRSEARARFTVDAERADPLIEPHGAPLWRRRRSAAMRSPVAPTAPAPALAPAPAPAPAPLPAPGQVRTDDPVLAEQIARALVHRAQELFDARVFLDAKQLAVEALVQSPKGQAAEQARYPDQARSTGSSGSPTCRTPKPAPPPAPMRRSDADRGSDRRRTAGPAVDTAPERPSAASRLTARRPRRRSTSALLGATIGAFFDDDDAGERRGPRRHRGRPRPPASRAAARRQARAGASAQIRTMGSLSVWGGVIGGLFGDSVKDARAPTARDVLRRRERSARPPAGSAARCSRARTGSRAATSRSSTRSPASARSAASRSAC